MPLDVQEAIQKNETCLPELIRLYTLWDYKLYIYNNKTAKCVHA